MYCSSAHAREIRAMAAIFVCGQKTNPKADYFCSCSFSRMRSSSQSPCSSFLFFAVKDSTAPYFFRVGCYSTRRVQQSWARDNVLASRQQQRNNVRELHKASVSQWNSHNE